MRYFIIILSLFQLFLTCIWERIRFPKQLSSRTTLDSPHSIWFDSVSPKQKHYFMSEMYLKPSQTSKMKLFAKVVKISRDVFRTSKMELFTKIMNVWKQLTFYKSSILNILLGPENTSVFTVFNYFHQKLHLRSLRGQRCLCMYIVPQIWRSKNEISKECYEET